MKIVLLGQYGLAEGYGGMGVGLKKMGIDIEFIGVMARIDEYVHGQKMSLKNAVNVFNKVIVQETIDTKADAVLLWKGDLIYPSTCQAWRKAGIKVIYFSWDDPFYIAHPKQCHNTLHSCPYIDLAFTSCEDSIRVYNKYGCKNVHLLWPGFDPDMHHPAVYKNDEEKADFTSDVSFVATNTYHPRFYPQTTGNRIDIVHALVASNVGDIKIWGFGNRAYGWLSPVYGDPSLKSIYKRYIKFEENHKVFSGSKINLNSHPIWGNKYLNERTFQILGAGSFMLVDAVTGIDQIFIPGVHFEIYRNLDELVDKVRFYLANPDKREAIAAAGMKEAYDKHTWLHRAQSFVSELEKL